MTEYDYSEEGYKRYMETQQRISRWVNDTNSHSSEYKRPFGARSDVGTEEPMLRSLNASPAPNMIKSRPRPHEYHGSTDGSKTGGGSDMRRSSSVHRPSPRPRVDSTDSESTYYDPDGPGPMPKPPGPVTSYPLRAGVSGIPPRQLSHLVDSISRSQSHQSHSRHSGSHGNRPNSGSNHSRITATRGRTAASPVSGPPQATSMARSSSLPRPFPHNDSLGLPMHGHGHGHHHHHTDDRHRHHHSGHHSNHHSHHHHHHHHRPRSRSTGPSISHSLSQPYSLSHSHSNSSGTTYEISAPTYIAPALGNNRPLIVPYSHRHDRGYYAPNEMLMSGSGYTIIPQKGTMVKVVI